MTCCQIAAGCGTPVTGGTGTSVASGHVLVDLSATQMPLYVDVCGGDMYYWNGSAWLILGKDDKFLLYDTVNRMLTLQPDGSSVQLPWATTTTGGLVKLGADSPIAITTDGTLIIDCAKLKSTCSLLDKSVVPSGNVIYFNTTTNMLDVDCAKLKAQCGLLAKPNAPTGNVIYYDASTTFLSIDLQALGDIINGPVVSINASGKLVVDCAALKAQCNLASMSDIPSIPAMPVSGPVVSINATTKELELNCTALKSQCNLASMTDIPAYSFAQQASLSGTTLHIANAQDPAAGVDVDLSSLVSSSGGGTAGGQGVFRSWSTSTNEGESCILINHGASDATVTIVFIVQVGAVKLPVTEMWDGGAFTDLGARVYSITRTIPMYTTSYNASNMLRLPPNFTNAGAGGSSSGIINKAWITAPDGVTIG